MSEEGRQYYGNNNKMKDRRYRKIFVGGLAWETQRESMKKYFEEFGEILEAVVITDKTSGRSKGYGFVTFKEEEAANRACQNPSPLIDGRRANCNIAYFGLNNNTPQYGGAGSGRFRSAAAGLMGTPPTYHPPPYFHHQPSTQPPFPYYGYTGYSHENMYNMNCYGGYGEEEAGSSGGRIGYFQNIYSYNYINPYAYGYGSQYPHPHQMIQLQQYPFYPQHFTPSSTPILSPPTTTTAAATGWRPSVGALASTGSAGATKTGTGSTCEQNAATNKTVTGSTCKQNAATNKTVSLFKTATSYP